MAKDVGDAAKQVERGHDRGAQGMVAVLKCVHQRSARAEVRPGGQGRAGWRSRPYPNVDARACMSLERLHSTEGGAGFDHLGRRGDFAARPRQRHRAEQRRRRLQGQGQQRKVGRVQPAHLAQRSDESGHCRVDHRRPRHRGITRGRREDRRHAPRAESGRSKDAAHALAAPAPRRGCRQSGDVEAGDCRR